MPAAHALKQKIFVHLAICTVYQLNAGRHFQNQRQVSVQEQALRDVSCARLGEDFCGSSVLPRSHPSCVVGLGHILDLVAIAGDRKSVV